MSLIGSSGPAGSATRSYRVSDAGAAIRAGAGCVRLTATAARCAIADEQLGDYDSLTDTLNARLGDGKDSAYVPVDLAKVPQLTSMDVTIDAGSGDDSLSVPNSFAALDGGPGSDRLNGSWRDDDLNGGGGGRDVLAGGGGHDYMSDGDSSAAPDQDFLDGGANSYFRTPIDGEAGDTVSYGDRTRRVYVNLAAGRGGRPASGTSLGTSRAWRAVGPATS